MSIYKKLATIQNRIKVGKARENKFGGYKYRSAEDIYEAAKPLLLEQELALFITDDIEIKGERFYVSATVTLTDGETTIHVKGYAREPLAVKGQSEAQITGASSSYARKYALNGLFQLDDNEDADVINTHEEPEKTMTTIDKKVDEMLKLAAIKKQDIGKIKMSIVNKYNKTNLSTLTELEIEPIMKWLKGL